MRKTKSNMLKMSSTMLLKKFLKYSNKKIPKKINNRSDIEQIKQTKITYCFLRPCSITNIFCAPMAKIKLNPVKNPSKTKLISCIFYSLA